MWSKLIGTFKARNETSIQIIAKEMYDCNNVAYHNWGHIMDCYEYLEAAGVPYNEALDFAVMHHDIVYDDQPEKELRSAEWMLAMYPDQTEGYDIIMATADHSIIKRSLLCSHMIKADLHQLGDPLKALINYNKILLESQMLYGVSLLDYASANTNFMRGLRTTVFENVEIDSDRKFWVDVAIGINFTIHISQGLKSSLTRL